MAWMSGAHKFDARHARHAPPTPTQASTPTMRLSPLLLPLVKLALDTTHGSTGERVHVARQLRKHAAPTAMGKRRLHVTKGLPQPLHGACQPCSLAWLGGFGAIPRLVVVGAGVAVWLGSCIWADIRRQVRPHNGEGVATEAAAWPPPHNMPQLHNVPASPGASTPSPGGVVLKNAGGTMMFARSPRSHEGGTDSTQRSWAARQHLAQA